jgi:hypothetical protein
MLKKQLNISAILQVCGVFAVVFSGIFTIQASAVRPAPVSLSQNRQLLGGTYQIIIPMPATVPHKSILNDSTPDGEMVVFTTTNSVENFVDGIADTEGTEDVIVRNMRTGQMICASCQVFQGLRSWGGTNPRISANGRFVVYQGINLSSSSLNLQIYRFDLQTGNVDLVSTGTAPGTQGDFSSISPIISDDGRYVAFISGARNLVAGYPNVSTSQLFVRDMQAAQTILVSHAAGLPSQPGNASISQFQPISMSGNGRFIVWTSAANDYLPSFGISDTNNATDVFYFDLQLGVFNIGVASTGGTGFVTGNGASFNGLISADSNQSPPSIVFASNATNISAADTTSFTDIYCYKGESVARLVSIAANGPTANAASLDYATISRNGRFVGFTSFASNLVDGISEPNSTTRDVFLRDLQTNTTRYVSLNNTGAPSATADGAVIPAPATAQNNNLYLNRTISDDGRYVAFATSEALSIRDNVGTSDLYVRDMSSGVSILATLSKSTSGGENTGLNQTGDLILTADGRKVLFTSNATNLASGDTTSILNAKVFRSNISLLSERSTSDLSGDGKNDFTVFRPSEGNWYALFDAAGGGYNSVLLGESGNRIAPGDYDGDGRTDAAVFIPSLGRWDILQSSNGSFVSKFFGTASDILTPADFDGDGQTDLAFFRPSNATWSILQSNTNSLRSVKFGLSGDVPMIGDFDGDNRADVAVFRPSSGDWWILRSLDNGFYSFHWGISTDKPLAGDFDGDGRTDAAVFRDGTWYVLNSRDGSYKIFQWGLGSDRIVVSDYDGDGRTDPAVFRPSNSVWYVLRSSDNNYSAVQWGASGDLPVPAAYIP